jgi:hypothetical protein
MYNANINKFGGWLPVRGKACDFSPLAGFPEHTYIDFKTLGILENRAAECDPDDLYDAHNFKNVNDSDVQKFERFVSRNASCEMRFAIIIKFGDEIVSGDYSPVFDRNKKGFTVDFIGYAGENIQNMKKNDLAFFKFAKKIKREIPLHKLILAAIELSDVNTRVLENMSNVDKPLDIQIVLLDTSFVI